MAVKRTNDHLLVEDRGKKPRMDEDLESDAGPSNQQPAQVPEIVVVPRVPTPKPNGKGKAKEVVPDPPKLPKVVPKKNIRKLVPARPFPTVPTSVNATGPRSAHKEGKNLICLSRKTGLGAYMRRCKDVILKDGYKTLHLSAMGAAIPLLLQLSCALPPILPFSKDEIQMQVTTGTCEVQDEVLPDDDDEDITYQTRSKSTLMVVIKIGDGEFEGDKTSPARKTAKNSGGRNTRPSGGNNAGGGNSKKDKGKGKDEGPAEIVYQEPEQDFMEML